MSRLSRRQSRRFVRPGSTPPPVHNALVAERKRHAQEDSDYLALLYAEWRLRGSRNYTSAVTQAMSIWQDQLLPIVKALERLGIAASSFPLAAVPPPIPEWESVTCRHGVTARPGDDVGEEKTPISCWGCMQEAADARTPVRELTPIESKQVEQFGFVIAPEES